MTDNLFKARYSKELEEKVRAIPDKRAWLEEKLSGKSTSEVSSTSEGFHWLTNSKGDKLCIFENKQIVIEYENIHLGNDTATCPLVRQNRSFNPFEQSDICRVNCPLTRQNINVEKLALERAKINARTQAKFNLDAERPRSLGANRGSNSRLIRYYNAGRNDTRNAADGVNIWRR